MSIVLCTLNARYSHASLGLRYLLANMGELQAQTQLQEFVIGIGCSEAVERLLALQPRIIGFGVYIWNVEETTRIIALLRRVAPTVRIIVGGPEVSYECEQQEIVRLADHVICGWGEVSLPKLCRQLLEGPVPLMKIIQGEQPPLQELTLPYDLYSDRDLAERTLYVEASRGCPFKCEFCLSALDKTAWPFELERVLAALETLYQRGARVFKFVDRTFNLKVASSARLLQFFLDKLELKPEQPLFAHFELVPDHLPEALKQLIARFPAGSLQFEIGIQTFNPEVQQLISRKQDNAAAEANLRWLRQHSQAHLHADLIAGLPGEDLNSFARGFDRLVALQPHEIQFGILKRLRGTPIIRHSQAYGLVFEPHPPYAIVATSCLDFATLQRLKRFARYWDLIANSGRFVHSLPLILADAPFARFMQLSDWLWQHSGSTHRIALERLAALVQQWLQEQGLPAQAAARALASDYAGARAGQHAGTGNSLARQQRHQQAGTKN